MTKTAYAIQSTTDTGTLRADDGTLVDAPLYVSSISQRTYRGQRLGWSCNLTPFGGSAKTWANPETAQRNAEKIGADQYAVVALGEES